ncbi:ATP-binding protein [Calditrichota bacterium GD2]
MNFDDERLIHFTVNDFQKLHELFIELFGKQSTFYFDEIQNIKGWERFVRRLHETGNKVYVTGSNALMVSKELGTHLTGRYVQYELYPFSFKEFLKFNNVAYNNEDLLTTSGRSTLKRWFNEYFKWGGFPEYLKNKNREYLKSLYESILYRDVLVRNKLSNEKEILEIMYFLASNMARLISYKRLKNIIGVKNPTTVKNYLGYLQNSYLVFLVNKFDHSLKNQLLNPKKAYLIDIAMANELGFHSTEDNGFLLENLVYLELLRRRKEVYYHKNKYECDFLIREKNRIVEAIQVTWDMDNSKTREREINGLLKTMDLFNLEQGLILSAHSTEDIEIKNKRIRVRPAWQWMLQVAPVKREA